MLTYLKQIGIWFKSLLCIMYYVTVFGGGPQWAKIKVHGTLIKQIYENGQIYEQNID